jgi:flagellar motor switch protein FliN/FliY
MLNEGGDLDLGEDAGSDEFNLDLDLEESADEGDDDLGGKNSGLDEDFDFDLSDETNQLTEKSNAEGSEDGENAEDSFDLDLPDNNNDLDLDISDDSEEETELDLGGDTDLESELNLDLVDETDSDSNLKLEFPEDELNTNDNESDLELSNDIKDEDELDLTLSEEEGLDLSVDDSESDDEAHHLDLSSLEDELGIDESEMVKAPEIKEIKDVESDDELERELASLADGVDLNNDTDQDIEPDLDLDLLEGESDSEGIVLDESMVIENLEPEAQYEEDTGTPQKKKAVEDVPSFMKTATDIDDSGLELDLEEENEEELELNDIDAEGDFDLSAEMLGDDEAGIGEISIEASDGTDDMLSLPEIEDDEEILDLSSGPDEEEMVLRIPENDIALEVTHPSQQTIREVDSSFAATAKPSLVGQDLLLNLKHELTVEIGKASLRGQEITELSFGSVIELDKKVGDPVDIVLGERIVAKGEVVQINEDQLGVRIIGLNF